MKNFNIFGFHGKIGFLKTKGDCLKRRGAGAWVVCRFKGGGVLGKKERGGVFEGGLIPQCTLCIAPAYNYYLIIHKHYET